MDWAAGPTDFEELETRSCVSTRTASGNPRRWREVEYLPGPPSEPRCSPSRSSLVLPPERSGASCVVYKNALWLYAGYAGEGRLDDLWRFDVRKRNWKRISGLDLGKERRPMARENNGAIVVGAKMYVFGGYSGFTWLNDFWSFCFETESWQLVPEGTKGDLPCMRFGYVAGTYDEVFFLWGGYDGSTWLNDMYEFDLGSTKKNTCRKGWVRTEYGQVQENLDSSRNSNSPGFLQTSPSGRSCPAFATHQDSIWLFGGYDGLHRLNDLHQFKMPTRTWTAVKALGQPPSSRYFHSAVIYDESFFVIGGYSGQTRLNDLYEFRIDCTTWFSLAVEDSFTGRSSLTAAVAGNTLFVFGG